MRPDLDAAVVARHGDAAATDDARGPPAVGVGLAAGVLVALVTLLLQTPGDNEVALGSEVVDTTFASLDAELRCARAQGCVRWAIPIEEAWRAPAALARAGEVVVGATRTRLSAWEVTSGDLVWERDLPAGTARGRTLLTVDDEVLLLDVGDATHAVDASDGRVLGTIPIDGVVRRAAVDGSRLRLAWLRADGATVEGDGPGYDTDSGDVPEASRQQEATLASSAVGVYDLDADAWVWERDLEVHALAPAIVGDEDGRPVVLDPATGERRLGFEPGGARLVVIGDALALQLGGEVQLRALADGRVRATVPGSLQPMLSPWQDGATVPEEEPLVVVDADVQRAVDADGRLQWERAPDEAGRARAPLRISRIGQGLLHVHGRAGEDGEPLLEAATGQEQARVPTEVVERGAPTALRAASATTLLVEAMGRTVAYDLQHDRELWSVTRGLPRGQSVVAADQGLAIVADPSRLLALEVP
jgi:outer membrane protein assembly factor BamB